MHELMQESPIEKINKQFEIISKHKHLLNLKDCIDSKRTKNTISYYNDVVQENDKRSLKAQKYFDSCKQYIAFFKFRSYQFLFNDYSLGRFFYQFDDKNCLLQSNLYWIPCPLNREYIKNIECDELEVMDFIDQIEDDEKMELDCISLRTPMRIDYTRNYNGRNLAHHPSWHLHYQNKDTRIKFRNVISLYGYFLFLLENCYPLFYMNQNEEKFINNLWTMEKDSRNWLKIERNTVGMFGKDVHTNLIFD